MALTGLAATEALDTSMFCSSTWPLGTLALTTMLVFAAVTELHRRLSVRQRTCRYLLAAQPLLLLGFL